MRGLKEKEEKNLLFSPYIFLQVCFRKSTENKPFLKIIICENLII